LKVQIADAGVTMVTETTFHGSGYIVTTGIQPEFHHMGLGRVLKFWEIAYAATSP
jgi:hypothetical protein